MSALSQAGKSLVTNEINRAFTKGLVGVDPSQLQRKQQQRRIYQEQLRKQAQQAQRRKAQEKRKLREQDEKLQRKIEMDILKQKQEKQNAAKAKQPQQQQINNSNPNNQNSNSNKNFGSNINSNPEPINQRKSINSNNSNSNNQQLQNNMPRISLPNGQDMNFYKNIVSNLGTNLMVSIPKQNQPLYPSQTKNYYQNYDQDRYFQQEIQNKARRFKETLDRKLDQVYQQIQSSKKQPVGENVIEQIRRRLKSNSYLPQTQSQNQLQKSGIKQFQQEFSQFYKIPKRQTNTGIDINNRTIRNLDLQSQSKFSSRLQNYPEQVDTNLNSRVNTERVEKTQYDNGGSEGMWGLRGKKNFLGNRQALDYQLESKLSNIQNIINTQTKMYSE